MQSAVPSPVIYCICGLSAFIMFFLYYMKRKDSWKKKILTQNVLGFTQIVAATCVISSRIQHDNIIKVHRSWSKATDILSELMRLKFPR
jgi:cadmium resistance protein CadD (predicted permease)